LKTYGTIVFILTIFICKALSQNNLAWKVLSNSPLLTSRYEDISFIDPQNGWAVSGTPSLIQTTDGGDTWSQLNIAPPFDNIYMRTVRFINHSTGFIGTLSSDHPLVMTTDGGETFSDVNISGKKPNRICGLNSYHQNIYGVGAYDGFPTFIKSVDSGKTWIGIDMSAYAFSLVDCYFFSDSVGLAVGSADGTTFYDGNSIVLRTTDQGQNWTRVYQSTRTGEWGWKLFFFNASIGYVSLEVARNSDKPAYYLKTKNQGLTWGDNFFLDSYDEEGIGFATESLGWIGGWTGPTYQTTNRGKTWSKFELSDSMKNLNRVRKINDTLMYAAGVQIFKYAPVIPTFVENQDKNLPESFQVFQNFPNPFNPSTTIKFELKQFSKVRVNIYNSVGQFIESILDNPKPPGIYSLQWIPPKNLASGVYFYQVQAEHETITKNMLYLK